MCAKLLPFFLLQLLLIIGVNVGVDASTPIVIKGPSPLNVSVNGMANFSCVVSNTELVLWYANDSNFDNIINFIEGHNVEKINNSNNFTYTLSFIVLELFETLLDNSDIKCRAVAFLPHYVFSESSEVKLRIQGVLDPPTDLFAEIISDVVSISWLPPVVLDGIEVYDYYINVTAYNSSGVIIHTANMTEFENITFPLVDQSACTVYSSFIQARSDAGLGHAGMADMVNTFEVPKKLNASQIGVQVIFTEDVITLKFTIEQDNCTGQQAENISAAIYYNADEEAMSDLPAEANDDGSISIKVSVPKSAEGTEVIAIITLINRVGSKESEPKSITIASTEKVIFTKEGSGVSFQCLFANLSHPKGCYVELECLNDQVVENIKLHSQDNSNISETGNIACTFSSCSTYDIQVYDIASDDSKGVNAWSEKSKTLCPPSMDASSSYIHSSTHTSSSYMYISTDTSSLYMYSSPMTSSTLDPKSIDDRLIGLFIVTGFIVIVCVISVISGLAWVCWKCCRTTKAGSQNGNDGRKPVVLRRVKKAPNSG